MNRLSEMAHIDHEFAPGGRAHILQPAADLLASLPVELYVAAGAVLAVQIGRRIWAAVLEMVEEWREARNR